MFLKRINFILSVGYILVFSVANMGFYEFSYCLCMTHKHLFHMAIKRESKSVKILLNQTFFLFNVQFLYLVVVYCVNTILSIVLTQFSLSRSKFFVCCANSHVQFVFVTSLFFTLFGNFFRVYLVINQLKTNKNKIKTVPKYQKYGFP